MAQGNLGVLFNNLRGKAGSVSFARSKDGTVIKPRITVKNPRTPAQQAVRAALVTASRTYKGFTAVQVSNWTLAASAITKRSARTSKAYVPTGNAYFVSLATKLLQINPAATLPVTPPSAVFAGDTITVTCIGATGKVTFTASAANATNVTTELLLQPLKAKNRVPTTKGYRSKGFQAFAAGTLTKDVTVTAGYYAPAYRFTNTLTGQVVGIQTLPTVLVS